MSLLPAGALPHRRPLCDVMGAVTSLCRLRSSHHLLLAVASFVGLRGPQQTRPRRAGFQGPSAQLQAEGQLCPGSGEHRAAGTGILSQAGGRSAGALDALIGSSGGKLGLYPRRHLPKAQLSGPRGSTRLPRPGLSAGEMLASEPMKPDPQASAAGGSLSPSPGDRGRAVIRVTGRGGGGGPAVSRVWLQAAAGAAVQTSGAGGEPGWRPGHGLKQWGSGRAGTVPVRSFFRVLSAELGHAAGLGSEGGSAGWGSRGNGEAFQALVVPALKTSQRLRSLKLGQKPPKGPDECSEPKPGLALIFPCPPPGTPTSGGVHPSDTAARLLAPDLCACAPDHPRLRRVGLLFPASGRPHTEACPPAHAILNRASRFPSVSLGLFLPSAAAILCHARFPCVPPTSALERRLL
ncbi:unnamed protein product [Rangifer tarandus platyrhynchus]|uniref:Uncharacterized protein n=1 Tax=Rangifer tarandus platyrhynchus TaxID=3082113 RepID=A0ABN8Z6E5_RANTA|nr:unnamed protein product [Rangifer tarandus platyrhynchus]